MAPARPEATLRVIRKLALTSSIRNSALQDAHQPFRVASGLARSGRRCGRARDSGLETPAQHALNLVQAAERLIAECPPNPVRPLDGRARELDVAARFRQIAVARAFVRLEWDFAEYGTVPAVLAKPALLMDLDGRNMVESRGPGTIT